MDSEREVLRKYKKLLEDVANKDFYKIDLSNRINCYRCSCGHITKTKDIDAGVTPMMFNCERCNGSATSTGYRDIAPDQQPTIEWYRPAIHQVMKMRRKPHMLDHILRGGLDYRKIVS